MEKAIWLLTAGALFAQPVAARAAETNGDTPEEIAEDAARDLKDSRFYNKPGASRAEYDADWQSCRLIARGSQTPAGSVPIYNPAMYNPAISPLAAGIGGGIGAAIGAAIVEGQMRRANRRNCLLIKGWRLVELPAAQSAKVAAMSDAERQSYFETVVGAQTVDGTITEMTSFTPVADDRLNMNGALAGPASLFLGKKVDPAAPFALGENEGGLVVAFRRNDAGSAGRSGRVQIRRFDRENGDLFYQPRDWKKKGDRTTYASEFVSKDKKAAYELQVVKLTPGWYVLQTDAVGMVPPNTTNCFGAPAFEVKAGEYAYLADATPFLDAALATGRRHTGMGYARNFNEAKAAMAGFQPDVAARMAEARIENLATYSCAGQVMTRMDFPGVTDTVPAPVARSVPAVAASEDNKAVLAASQGSTPTE
ncbi:hypothetical protein [Sphingopyxis sp. BE235]|uniref:hypothetical protein n=1 Tax=unclassified Sphingopyxis TaxID=2614943 RepID=UPI00285D4A68|nr:hypothetical protein [Sphingopyxis sp. BE235]MDR7060820.1 hypothetical protein [Sphingopyxis sp. BE235]MDR7181277.1 hypothetical protein [Sphingopyxis sp. BE249]